MRMVKLSKANDCPLKGVKIEFQTVDDSLEAVVITDLEGNSIRITKSESYSNSIKVLVEKPHDEEVHVFVEGVLFDNKISKSFGKKDYQSERDAKSYIDGLPYSEIENVKVIERVVKVDYDTQEVLKENTIIDDNIPF